jgi:hypothetical protein
MTISNRLTSLVFNYKAFLLSALALLAPIEKVLLTTIALVLTDMAAGVWAAKKRGESIQSAKLGNTARKLFVYLGVIVMGFFVEQQLLSDVVPLVKLLSGVIAVVEMKSLLENSEDILGQPIFKVLIEKLSKKDEE